MTTLSELNSCDTASFIERLRGIYEHSPWIPERAAAARPFASITALKQALQTVVSNATLDEQLGLIRAHPELAGKAAISGQLTAESTHEQAKSGLHLCSAEEFTTLHQLNADYNARFGFPFILAVKGPDGQGLTRRAIIATFSRRLKNQRADEIAECLRQIKRIAELRINDLLSVSLAFGPQIMQWSEQIGAISDADNSGDKDFDLTCAYLTPAHRQTAAQLLAWMQQAGMEAHIDAVGNVVGVYRAADASAPTLMTGSHYDTVRNGGKYDGRLGVLVPMACVKTLHAQQRRLPFGIEVVAFSEEEGQRFKASFLASSALTGEFDPAWLEQVDTEGVTMSAAMQAAGLSADMADIGALRRESSHYLGFVEVHIEQGPVLNELDLPLGVVTSINGSVRYLGEVRGLASHAGTTPMSRRRDAAAAVAELVLYVEQRAAAVPDVVGTIGQLLVPNGSINVIPGRCQFSLDLRATSNAARDALDADVKAELARICARRGLHWSLEQTMAVDAAPSDLAWMARWEAAVRAQGLPVLRLPSGAGHDAMMLHKILPQAMLFLRGFNGGISHNPLESISNDDAQLCVQAFQSLLEHLAEEFK